MGWKTLKEKLCISHIVHVRDDFVCIGSGYIGELVKIDAKTGLISENSSFEGFLKREYPLILGVSKKELIDLIAAADEFGSLITVFTYEGSEIIERQCEAVGWPNVTCDGHIMHNNTYSTDKDIVIGWAKYNMQCAINNVQDDIDDIENDLVERKARKARYEAALSKLNADYPTTEG